MGLEGYVIDIYYDR